MEEVQVSLAWLGQCREMKGAWVDQDLSKKRSLNHQHLGHYISRLQGKRCVHALSLLGFHKWLLPKSIWTTSSLDKCFLDAGIIFPFWLDGRIERTRFDLASKPTWNWLWDLKHLSVLGSKICGCFCIWCLILMHIKHSQHSSIPPYVHAVC